MLKKFKFIFKDFKKAVKYAEFYNKYTQNPFNKDKVIKKTCIWIEDIKDANQVF